MGQFKIYKYPFIWPPKKVHKLTNPTNRNGKKKSSSGSPKSTDAGNNCITRPTYVSPTQAHPRKRES